MNTKMYTILRWQQDSRDSEHKNVHNPEVAKRQYNEHKNVHNPEVATGPYTQ
jgi:hypothetical protein